MVAFTVAELFTRHWIVMVTVAFGARFVPVTLTVFVVVLEDTVPAVELALSKSTARGKVSFIVQLARVAVPVFLINNREVQDIVDRGCSPATRFYR